jgi:hypothetical protein
VRFQVLKAADVKGSAFRYVAPYSLVKVVGRFRDA